MVGFRLTDVVLIFFLNFFGFGNFGHGRQRCPGRSRLVSDPDHLGDIDGIINGLIDTCLGEKNCTYSYEAIAGVGGTSPAGLEPDGQITYHEAVWLLHETIDEIGESLREVDDIAAFKSDGRLYLFGHALLRDEEYGRKLYWENEIPRLRFDKKEVKLSADFRRVFNKNFVTIQPIG